MYFPKVIIYEISKNMDIQSVINLLKTCKTYYAYRKIICELLDCNNEEELQKDGIYND